jgi:mannose-6-phosphate isomerase-like protein (cupin superfamily)
MTNWRKRGCGSRKLRKLRQAKMHVHVRTGRQSATRSLSAGVRPSLRAGAWFILDGTFAFEVTDRTFEIGAGAFVLAQRGTAHTLWATGPEPHRWLPIFSPSGMEGYFREFAHNLHMYQHASMEEIQSVASKYHFDFVEKEQPTS